MSLKSPIPEPPPQHTPSHARRRWSRALLAVVVVCSSALIVGCPRLHMYDQPRYEELESSGFFPDGAASQRPPQGTIARGSLREDRVLYTGMLDDSTFTSELPLALTPEMLARGRERFGIYCAVCHDAAGTGQGMVVRRGFKRPTSFHEQRMRDEPVGYYFDVITNGFATMPSYAAQVAPHDRWAIIAYIRALQLSQNLELDTLGADTRRDIEAALTQAARDANATTQPEPHD